MRGGGAVAVCVAALLGWAGKALLDRAACLPSQPAPPSAAYLATIGELRRETGDLDGTVQYHSILVIGGTGTALDMCLCLCVCVWAMKHFLFIRP